MVKKISTIVIVAVLLGAGLGIFQVYWKNFRGAAPALQKPPFDIADMIENQGTIKDTNTTQMPLKLPAGFSISIFAKNLGAARVMAFDQQGTMLVSIPARGTVVALPEKNGDHVADSTVTVIGGLNKPHGLAFRCREKCQLYIAESNQVAVYDYDPATMKASNKKKIIDLPNAGRHFSRTIMFMPFPNEDRLLIAVGSSCDTCDESDPLRAKVLVANYDGSDLKIYASGLRNSVFMALHPVNGKIWATEMGRDFLGDNLPPDEVNILEEGKNYGWPICYGKNVHDEVFDKKVYIRAPCTEPFETPSHVDLHAHSAPLGIAFIPEEGWPEDWWYNALVSYHGSWNSTEPTGYKIVRLKLDAQGKYAGTEDFITGWLTKAGVVGRPVDILVQPGGTMYVSDDKAGVIYRIARSVAEANTSTSQLVTAKGETDMLKLDNLKNNDLVEGSFTLTGKARGNWFFEASFPIKIYADNGTELGTVIAQAQGEWMTKDYVPFTARVIFDKPPTDAGTIVLQKDNPSGLPEHDDSVTISVRFP